MEESSDLASGIAVLVTIAARITKISSSLISDFGHAPRSQESLLLEILWLKDTLVQARQSCEEAEAARLPVKWPHTLSDKTLAECRNHLLTLQLELQTGMSRAAWLLKEKQFEKHGEALRRFRDIFGVLVSVNTLTAVSHTHQQVRPPPVDNDRAMLLRWLERSEETSRPLPSPTPATGEWFLSSQQYQGWINIGGPQILWCTGAPGAGKSMLASIAVRDLLSRPKCSTAIITYFFCDSAAQQQQNLVTVLQSILRQIIAYADAQLLSALSQLRAKACHTRDVHVLSAMLKAACNGTLDLFIIFDAPDELASPGPVLRLLKDVAAEGSKILVASRDMCQDLANHLSGATRLRVEASAEDIKSFVGSKFQFADVYHNALGIDDLAIAIANKANGIFLIARILVDELLEVTTIKKMRKALEAMPAHLNQAYELSLRRIENQPAERRQLARKVISWITYARRRLSIMELQHALALDEDDDELNNANIPNMDLLIKICAGIVTITDDDKVSMIHTTAYEFFRQRYGMGFDGEIAKTSLQYLRLPVFQEPCKTLNNVDKKLTKMPFLSYAASYCAHHIHKAQAEKMFSESILKIMSDENLRSTVFQATRHEGHFHDRELAEEPAPPIPSEQSELHLAAYWNFSHILKLLLHDGCNMDQRDSQGWTPLHWACFKGSSAAIDVLINAEANVTAQDSRGWTPLFWSAFNGDDVNVEYMLQNGASCVIKDVHQWSALTWATVSASPERVTVITKLLEHYQKDRESALTEQDESPLDLADARGDSNLFEALLARQDQLGINIYQLWSTGQFEAPATNVWRAASRGESGFGINYSFRNPSLLNLSIRDGKRTIMRVLLDLGAPVNLSGSDIVDPIEPTTIRSPLHWATFKKNPLFVQDLVCAGADVHCIDAYGQTALHQAVLNGCVEAAASLIKAHSDVNLHRLECPDGFLSKHPKQTPLMLACGLGLDGRRNQLAVSGTSDSYAELTDSCSPAVEMVSLLLASGADPCAKDSKNRSVMHYAVMCGQHGIVTRLLAAGATFEGRSDEGTSMLHQAAKGQDMDILDLVINAGPDLMAADFQGKNVFHYLALRPLNAVAAERLAFLVDSLLSKCGVKMLNAGCLRPQSVSSAAHGEQLRSGVTPLALAFESGNWLLATIYYEKGAVLPQGFPTSTWLRPAVFLNSLEGVQLLLKLGVQPEDVEWPYFPGLSQVCSSEGIIICGHIVKEMVDAGLIINRPLSHMYRFTAGNLPSSTNYDTIMSTAVSLVDDDGFIQLLLDLGADPRIPRSDGMDCFIAAALQMRWITLDTLLKHVATAPGYSTYWSYVSTAFPHEDSASQLCQALKQHGEIERVWNGQTLLHLATIYKNQPLVSALLSCGADPNVAEHNTGFTALHHAVYSSSMANVASLIKAGANVNARTSKWHDTTQKPSGIYAGCTWPGTPLHLAAMRGWFDVAEMLVNSGADVNAEIPALQRFEIPSQGPTALHITLSTGKFYSSDRKPDLCDERLRMAELLIERGASVKNVARHLTANDAKHFKGREQLWNTLRRGIEREADDNPETSR